MTRFRRILTGGRSEGMSPEDFDPKQLRIGQKHEMEHVANTRTGRHLALEIAMDHLAEDKNYYRKLKKAGL